MAIISAVGTILGPSWILTAGTCCSGQDPEDVSVRAGGKIWNEIQVESMWLHPSFDAFTLEHNVCLLELTNDILFDENAQPATIAPDDAEYPGGTQCTETGWQEDQEGSWSVTIMSDATCGIGPFMCGSMDVNAGDPCKLNSGGPLTCQDGFAGVLSYRDGCIPRGSWTLYGGWLLYLNWINDTMGV
eukprot:TRINITY_DN10812_c0_g1_i1.p1 TRINITY_DN10812_c0_g1~~TRINITY_DN10812_c0_g1_i1.p1  ORF type:complete len:187 (-),score=27.31 TRINITY_DN10812_c0_g1_i1:30-590(-)